MTHQIVVIGAGPVGLEAALYAAQLGYDVTILEKNQVGANMLDWGYVTLFSPWKMNHSPLGVAELKRHFPEWETPSPETYQTGREYVETYLRPLSQLPQLKERILTGVKVTALGRERILKGDFIGDNRRTHYPFRILARDASGTEKVFHAHTVIDATGVYGNPNWLGTGGIPAIGEEASRNAIDYGLRDIYGAARSRFIGKKILLIGSGYSAATTVHAFQNLNREEPETSLIWAIREDRELPIPVIQNDALPNRAALTERANQIVKTGSPNIEFRNKTTVESIHYDKARDSFSVELKNTERVEDIQVDRVIANVGFGPDNSLYRELQVHECYASRGPMKLAATLLSSSSVDCLDQTSPGADTLKNPEPNFYIIGNKSYGRNPTFLIRIGLSQITEVFSLITDQQQLNLYEERQNTEVSQI